MNVFKFKADYTGDVERLQKLLPGEYESQQIDDELPDVEVVLTTDLSLEEVVKLMLVIPDGYLMADTVNTIDKYTGKRRYITTEGETVTDLTLLNKMLREILK